MSQTPLLTITPKKKAMNNKEKLEYYLNLNYDIITNKIGSNFSLLIPELAIQQEDDNLDVAYKRLEEDKKKYFKSMIARDQEHYINLPTGEKSEKVFTSEVLSFMTKFVLSVLVSLLILIITIKTVTPNLLQIKGVLVDTIISAVDHSAKLIARDTSIDMTTHLKNLPKKLKDIPDERKEKLRRVLRDILLELKPFIDDAKTVLSSDSFEDQRLIKKDEG